jgi:hypothetical protein
MSEQIKTITEREQFPELFSRYFAKSEVFLKTKSGDLKIQFIGFSNGLAAFKIPYIKNIVDTCLVYSRIQNSIIYASLKASQRQGNDLYVFIPINLQIISLNRKEDRQEIGTRADGKNILYVTNLISDFIIENILAMQTKKVEAIKDTTRADLAKFFEHIKIYFCNEGMSDARMKYFYDVIMPIYISDFKKKPSEKDEKIFNNFMNNIYSKDYYLLNRKDFVSEISVPILFKMKIPFGYIQVNNTTPIAEGMFQPIKSLTMQVAELFAKSKIFPLLEEKLLVSDVSKSGLGVVFNDRRYIRYFKEKCRVFFELILPGDTRASIVAVVRNIAFMDNKVIKIGCEIKEMDAISEVNYEEYLASVGLT